MLVNHTADRVGERLREARLRQKVGVRELSRRIGVSASLISQIELGRATPSVQTLYAIVSELNLSLDELFSEPDAEGRDASPGVDATPAATASSIVSPEARESLSFVSGVLWERLTPTPDPNVDFLRVTYPPGAASCDEGALMRHAGHEYGYVLAGELTVTVGFESHVLGPGDSVSFESSMPHRLHNAGGEDVLAIWAVVGRQGDARVNVAGGSGAAEG